MGALHLEGGNVIRREEHGDIMTDRREKSLVFPVGEKPSVQGSKIRPAPSIAPAVGRRNSIRRSSGTLRHGSGRLGWSPHAG